MSKATLLCVVSWCILNFLDVKVANSKRQPKPDYGTDLFNVEYRKYWTPNRGNWTNITGYTREIASVKNFDREGLSDTFWIGEKMPESLQWFNYTVFVHVMYDSYNPQNGSIGIVFGATDKQSGYCMLYVVYI